MYMLADQSPSPAQDLLQSAPVWYYGLGALYLFALATCVGILSSRMVEYEYRRLTVGCFCVGGLVLAALSVLLRWPVLTFFVELLQRFS
jgi:hypothetical protein